MTKIILIVSLILPAFASAADLIGSTDRDLKITVKELRGIQPATRNKLFVKVIVERGSKSFGVFCDRFGKVNDGGSINGLSCALNAQTVSHDDDESFQFNLTVETNSEGKTATSIENILYSGDGTILGDKVEILTAMQATDKKIEKMVIGLAPARATPIAAFREGALMVEALSPLIARRVNVPVGRIDLQVPVKEVSFSVAADMVYSVNTKLDASEFQNIEVKNPATVKGSLLQRAGNLDSNFRLPVTIKDEVIQKLDIR